MSTSLKKYFPVGTPVKWSASAENYITESGELTLDEDTVINVDLFRDTDWIWTNIPSTIDTSKLTFADGYKPSTNPLATPFSVRDHKHKLTEINLHSNNDNYPAILSTEGLTKMEVYSDFLKTFDIYTKVYGGLGPDDIINAGGTLEQIILSHTPNLTKFSVGASGKLKKLYVDDFSHVTSMKEAFYGNSSLEYISPMYLDSCIDLSYMFAHCQFPVVPTTLHNTSNVNSTAYMFMACKNITTVPLFDTSNVTDMYSMFNNCTSLTSVPLFNTQKATDMRSMFRNCTSLTEVPLFDTQNVTRMYGMFRGCTSLTSVPLFNISNVTSIEKMFRGCTSLTSVPAFNTQNVTQARDMFSYCTSLTEVSLFDTSNVTDMWNMFNDCSSLTTVPLFNTQNVTEMRSMFHGCTSLTTVPLFNTQNVKYMSQMFFNCTSLTTVPLFDTQNVTQAVQMFQNCTSLTDVGGFAGLKVDIDFHYSPLTHASALNIIDNLAVPPGSPAGHTITFKRSTFDTLTPAEIARATDKGWEIVAE